MSHRQVLTLWASDAGQDFWLENNGGRRIGWSPGKGNPYSIIPSVANGTTGTVPAGTAYDGSAEAARDLTSSEAIPFAGSIDGCPDIRSSHIFKIPVNGYDKMWIQWSGELVSITGITSNLGAGGTRTAFSTAINAVAHGIFHEESALGYTQFPPAVVYSSLMQGKSGSTLGRMDASTATSGCGEMRQEAGSTALWVAGPGRCNVVFGTANPNRFHGTMTHAPLLDQSTYITTVGGGSMAERIASHIWGYEQFVVSNLSRFPVAGDRYGFVLQVGYGGGYSSSANTIADANGIRPVAASDLSIGGLEYVLFSLFDIASTWTTNTTYAGTTHLIIKGRLYAILETSGRSI